MHTPLEGEVITEASNVETPEATAGAQRWTLENSLDSHSSHVRRLRMAPYLAHLWGVTWALSQTVNTKRK